MISVDSVHILKLITLAYPEKKVFFFKRFTLLLTLNSDKNKSYQFQIWWPYNTFTASAHTPTCRAKSTFKYKRTCWRCKNYDLITSASKHRSMILIILACVKCRFDEISQWNFTFCRNWKWSFFFLIPIKRRANKRDSAQHWNSFDCTVMNSSWTFHRTGLSIRFFFLFRLWINFRQTVWLRMMK